LREKPEAKVSGDTVAFLLEKTEAYGGGPRVAGIAQTGAGEGIEIFAEAFAFAQRAKVEGGGAGFVGLAVQGEHFHDLVSARGPDGAEPVAVGFVIGAEGAFGGEAMRGAEAPGREEVGEELLGDLGGEVGAEEQGPKLAEAITLEAKGVGAGLRGDNTSVLPGVGEEEVAEFVGLGAPAGGIGGAVEAVGEGG